MMVIINRDNWVRNLNPLICIEMGNTEGLFNSSLDNEITLVKLLELYCYLRGGLHLVLMSTHFGDVYVFSIHDITLFCYVCFVHITN